MSFDQHDRRAGSLICQALGDALGFLVEGCGPELCTEYVTEVFSKFGPPPYHRASFDFGQYSDDTQLARELALSLDGMTNDPPEYFAAVFARRVARQFSHGLIVGRGSATEAAAHRLIQGVPWGEAGTPAPNAGNGAAMRAAPIGFLPDTYDVIVRMADDSARVTHADERSRAAAVLVALVVAHAIRNGPARATAQWFGWLSHLLKPHDPLLASGVRKMVDWITDDPKKVSDEITAWCKPPENSDHQFERWKGISPFATPSVLYALFAYVRTPDDPEEVLKTAISVGGDVDTVAAMAGAMVGAAVGLGGLTPRLGFWASFLNDQGFYKADELAEIARRVW